MKTVIFDFDGTIADTLESAVNAYNEIAKQKNYKQVTLDNRDFLRGLSPQKVMTELGVSILDLPRVAIRLQKAMRSSVSSWKPHAGIPELIKQLKGAGDRLIILSSNSAENVRQFLQDHNMDVFDQISTGSSVFGKARLLRQVFKDQKIPPSDAIYIGDEIRDIEAAKKAGCRVVSVTWGLNNKDALENYHPDHLADNPSQIPNFL